MFSPRPRAEDSRAKRWKKSKTSKAQEGKIHQTELVNLPYESRECCSVASCIFLCVFPPFRVFTQLCVSHLIVSYTRRGLIFLLFFSPLVINKTEFVMLVAA
jgi:hypothetical protein